MTLSEKAKDDIGELIRDVLYNVASEYKTDGYTDWAKVRAGISAIIDELCFEVDMLDMEDE